MRSSIYLLLLLFPLFPLPTKGQIIDSLEIGNLKAIVNGVGNLGYADSNSYRQGLFYPNPSPDNDLVLFKGSYWIGGHDPSDSLHLSKETYGGSGKSDYHPGPIADTYDANYDNRYKRVWKIDRDSIEYHANNWWKSGYQTPQAILDWPAHGDTSNGEAYQLAPFKDMNSNGSYEPSNGDRPIIRGDRAIYFIANDLRKVDSADVPLGVEIHGMVYAFDCPNDSSLHNSVMIHYDMINRSSTSYDSLMIGHFSDFDNGCATDDYVGTDVERGLAFAYNGDGFDQQCNGVGYDSLPPAAGQVFLQGPELEPNGTDDAWNGPGKGSVNGVGFGDGTPDNEHWGMQHAYYYLKSSGSPWGDPQSPQEYYNYMTGTWRDSTPITFGGDGYEVTVPPSDTLARFMFPWDTDPQHYSTYGTPAPYWSEGTAGYQPGDRRIMASTGPSLMDPGDTLELDMGYVVAQDPSSPGDSIAPVAVMKERVDSLRSYFLKDEAPCSDGSFSSIPEKDPSFSAKAFPNPSGGRFKIELKGPGRSYRYELYNIRGSLIKSGHWNGNGTRALRIEGEGEGLYFLRIRSQGESKVLKLVKR